MSQALLEEGQGGIKCLQIYCFREEGINYQGKIKKDKNDGRWGNGKKIGQKGLDWQVKNLLFSHGSSVGETVGVGCPRRRVYEW